MCPIWDPCLGMVKRVEQCHADEKALGEGEALALSVAAKEFAQKVEWV